MAYSDFKSVDELKQKFSIAFSSNRSFFKSVPEVGVSTFLQELLEINVPLALNINTEKARSELIIMPILVEVYKQFDRRISLFSGVDFTVDTTVGLNGYCDYILSNSADQLYLSSPVICLVEGKNENLRPGYPQCIAEMIAAQRFNMAQANPIDTIWGVVTTGSNWKFLSLQGNHAAVDYDEYLIADVDKILAIFQYIFASFG